MGLGGVDWGGAGGVVIRSQKLFTPKCPNDKVLRNRDEDTTPFF